MSYDHGPLLEFEVTWKSGHVETIWAHQCTLPTPAAFVFRSDEPRWVTFHGEVNGRWQMILNAPEADILSVRNLTAAPEANR